MAGQELSVGQGQDSGVPVAIYTRVSTDNQTGGRFDSCESQAAICREMIRKREAEGWHEIACFSDAAYSGGTMDRPGIRALKRQIEAGEVKVVLIFKMERVLRSTDEWVPFRSFLQKHGCRLESATEDISEATPSGRLKNNLLMSVAEYERLNTAEKTRAKLFQQAKQGIWNGGWVPYGFDYDEKSQMLVPSPTEAPVLRRIFAEAAKFKSLEAVAKSLNDEGLRTRVRQIKRRSGKIQKVGGNLFRSDGLRMMLKNPIYRGAIRFGGQEHPARHKPLVSESVWHKANAVALDVQASPEPRVVNRDSQTYLLKGLIHCFSCGRAMTPHDSGKKKPNGAPYRYYYCGKVLKERRSDSCPVGRLPADGVEAVVTQYLTKVSQHPTIVSAVINSVKRRRKVDIPALEKEIRALQRSVSRVSSKLKNCVNVVASGESELVSQAFSGRIAELEQQRQKFTADLERKKLRLNADTSTVVDEKRVVNALGRLGEVFDKIPMSEQKKLCRLFIEKIEMNPVKGKAGRGKRLLEFRMKIHLPRLVSGLELPTNGPEKPRESVGLLPSRGANFRIVADFTQASEGQITINSPFVQTLAIGGRVSKLSQDEPNPAKRTRHPIHDAIKWQKSLDAGQIESRAALARKLGMTRSSVTINLHMITLIPEIKEFLLALRKAEQIREFSLRKMHRLAQLPEEKQREWFSGIRT